MHRSVFIAAAIFLFMTNTFSQTTGNCGFDKLFTLKPGMDKSAVMNKLQTEFRVHLTDSQYVQMKLPYLKPGEAPVANEVLSYRVDSSECFKGLISNLKLEFADNKLYKVYISTEFTANQMQDLTLNFNYLRNDIKSKWKYEKAIKMKTDYMKGTGYTYRNSSKSTSPKEYVSLLGVTKDGGTNVTGKDIYVLEVIWVNLNGTRMQSAAY